MSKQSKSDLVRQKEIEHRNIVMEYFKLIVAGKFKEGLRFFSPDCKTHNPLVAGSVDVLTDAMVAASKEGSELSILKQSFLSGTCSPTETLLQRIRTS
jgi:hypothetical protein